VDQPAQYVNPLYAPTRRCPMSPESAVAPVAVAAGPGCGVVVSPGGSARAGGWDLRVRAAQGL